jgi:hypothetical protein
MATLELAIDATKAQQGAQVAQQAFVKVQTAAEAATKAAERTGQAVSDSGAKMNAAFQATGGSLQIAGGIAQTAKAFGELNVQAGLFNSSRLLLEIGKTANDFRELASGVSGVSGAFGTLTAIIKANPLLAAATAIGAIATAIGLFASETDKATASYQKFGEGLRDLKIDAQTAAYLGIAGPGVAGQAQRLIEASRTAMGTGQGINLRDFTGTELDRRAAQIAQRQIVTGTYEAGQLREFLATGGTRRFGGARGERETFTAGLPDIQLTQEQTQELLRELYRETAKQLESEKASAEAAKQAAEARRQITDQLQSQVVQFGAERLQPGALGGFEMRTYQPPYYLQAPTVAPGTYQFGAGPAVQTQMPQVGFPTGPYVGAEYQYQGGRLRPEYQVQPGQAPPLLQRPQGVMGMSDMGGMAARGFDAFNQSLEQSVLLAGQIAEYKKQEAEDAQRVAENFARAADYAGQVGGSLGSAFADVLMKTTTLRQAFASIVASFARQGLADVGSSIFRGFVSGITPTQAQGNAGMRTPGGP